MDCMDSGRRRGGRPLLGRDERIGNGRVARSLAAAVGWAIDPLESVSSLRVACVELEDLVTMREIAEHMAGAAREDALRAPVVV